MSDEFNNKCPACDGTIIDIAVKCWARLYPDGTVTQDAEDQSHEWSDNSAVQCCECGWSGKAKDLGMLDGMSEVDQNFCEKCGVLRALHENGCPVVEGELP